MPITPPPGIPLPYLVDIRTGDHADFAWITFAFRGAFPEYNFAYGPDVRAEGSGIPIELPGNAFLRIQFVHAQAHDNTGASTIRFALKQAVGIGNFVGYAPAGDFEGYVTYGLGIRVAPNSDQAWRSVSANSAARTGSTWSPSTSGRIRPAVSAVLSITSLRSFDHASGKGLT